VYTAQITLFPDVYNPVPLPEMGYSIAENSVAGAQSTAQNITKVEYAVDLFESLEGINWTVMISSFIIFFIFGYILYASIFAAIGAVIDQDTETQQFVLPVSLPLILSIILLQGVIANPESPLAFWLSIIPFTSPVIMLARLPFGIPYWELIVSIAVLLITCLFFVYISSKMYRAGIVHYGKKMSISSIFSLFFGKK